MTHDVAASLRGAGPRGLAPRWRTHPWTLAETPVRGVRAAWAHGDACAFLVAADDAGAVRPHAQPFLWVLGTADAATDLLAEACRAGGALREGADVVDLAGGCVPRGTAVLDVRGAAGSEMGVPVLLRRAAGSHWDWFWTGHAPPEVPGEDRVHEIVGAADLSDLRAAQQVANPHAELTPGTPGTRWWAWHDEAGMPRAVAGARVREHGWELGGIGTQPAVRGRGAGAAVVAAATRAALADAPRATLGMYADNVPGRRLYASLGYAVGQEFSGWRTAA